MTQEEADQACRDNATTVRDRLREEKAMLERTLNTTELRLEMVTELLAMLEGRPEPARAPRRNSRRSPAQAMQEAQQQTLPENQRQESAA